MKKHTTSAISQLFGKFASKEFAPWFQKIVNNGYVKIMGLDMSEFREPNSYKSLNALFIRTLRVDREFSLDGQDFIAPCDSLITETGALDDDYALQIKGMRYKASELIGDSFTKEEQSEISGGDFINFYLSPKD
ncbi:MAG: phosphatidylserine decarboxylase, partial [Atribacterota bacterium]|nr:phosphatidylserine decarboxylase [Atribacterota bacterium]